MGSFCFVGVELRSRYLEFLPKKNKPLFVAKTILAPIYCKRKEQSYIRIHVTLLVKRTNLSENPIARALEMQQHIGQIDEELMKMNERLGAAEEEGDRALGQLGEINKEVVECNSLKELLSNMAEQLKEKEKDIESIKVELNKAKQLDLQLVEKDALLEKLKEELCNFKASDACQSDFSFGRDKRIQELEADVDKWKNSETKLLVSFAAQTKQLEQTKISLEESKLEISSLQEKMKKSSGQTSNDLHHSMKDLRPSMKEALESFKSELQSAKQILVQAKEGEKLALSKATSLLKERDLLKHELKMATEAEENSKKAMDDLAMALKEVAAEAKQVNEKLSSTQEELESIEREAENLKSRLKSTEDEYKIRIDEVRKEADRFRNTSKRLRLEAMETLLTWNEKETGFVDCIKRIEEEKASLIEENNTLLQALAGAENLTRKAKDENQKLRDILKQALNESNIAKEAAAIARAENSQLKDVLAEKNDALDFITRENENLRVNEASALESIEDFKRLLAESSLKDSKPDENDKEQGSEAKQQQQNSQDKEKKDEEEQKGNKEHKDSKEQKDNKEHKDSKEHKDDKEHKYSKNKIGKTFSFSRKDLKISNKHKEAVDDELHKTQNKHKAEEPKDEVHDEGVLDTDDMMKGSIFDVAATLVSNTEHHRKKSSSTFTFTVDGETISSEDLEHLEAAHCDDENDKSSRKKRALLRRFGDILRRRSLH